MQAGQIATRRHRAKLPLTLPCLYMLLVTTPVLASNGLNLIGFGAESHQMGGADLAVSRDTMALNLNPAGLSQIRSRRLDNLAGVSDAFGSRHSDGFGNDEAYSDSLAYAGNLGYAERLSDLPLTLGIGLFAQGGSGVNFDTLATAFGTRDELSTRFLIGKLSVGGAWQANDRLSVGAALSTVYSRLDQRVFPDTSSAPFFGTRLDDMYGVGVGYKLGLMYRVRDDLTLGIAYTSATEVELEHGSLTADMSDIGLGKVTYSDVTATGLDQPQELGIGLAWQPNESWLLAAEINWIDWSEAVNESVLTASGPDTPLAPATLSSVAQLNWRDQYVIAFGMAHRRGPWTLRTGYNYGRNPIPAANTNPLLAAIGEHHLTAGVGYQIDAQWRIDGGFEYQFANSQRFTNPQLPFGPDAEETVEYLTVMLMLSREW